MKWMCVRTGGGPGDRVDVLKNPSGTVDINAERPNVFGELDRITVELKENGDRCSLVNVSFDAGGGSRVVATEAQCQKLRGLKVADLSNAANLNAVFGSSRTGADSAGRLRLLCIEYDPNQSIQGVVREPMQAQ